MAMDSTDDWEWAMEGWAASCHHLEQVAARLDSIAFDFAQRDEDLHAELISARDYALIHARDRDAECRPSCGAKDERGCDGYEHCGCRCHDGDEPALAV